MNNIPELAAQLQNLLGQLVEIKVEQARNNQLLEEHMRRTAAAEAHLDILQAELAPIKAHVSMWAGAGKLLAAAASIVGVVAGLAKLLGH